MAEIDHHPLIFTFRDAISGQGFLAGISICGRALMVHEDDKWWMYGVRPAAFAESGETPQETLLNFRNAYREILFDIADERSSFEAFKQEVERFFHDPDPEEERRWDDALKATRSGGFTPPPPLDALERVVAETRPPKITVERLDVPNRRFMPSDNVPDTYLLPKAA
jgi:hypothetical protein